MSEATSAAAGQWRSRRRRAEVAQEQLLGSRLDQGSRRAAGAVEERVVRPALALRAWRCRAGRGTSRESRPGSRCMPRRARHRGQESVGPESRVAADARRSSSLSSSVAACVRLGCTRWCWRSRAPDWCSTARIAGPGKARTRAPLREAATGLIGAKRAAAPERRAAAGPEADQESRKRTADRRIGTGGR